MPISARFRAPFFPGCNYHLLFRSIDGVKLFRQPEDRAFYLHQFSSFFHPIVRPFAYALLDNHTHFIVQVKNLNELVASISAMPGQLRTKPMEEMVRAPTDETLVAALVERQVNSFMASFAKVTNKIYCRRGGLFQSPFRRTLVGGDKYLQQSIIYTHANAQKHGIVDDFTKYPFTSYFEILSGNSRYIDSEMVLAFFGGRDKFVTIHKMQADFFYGRNVLMPILEMDQ